MFQILPSSFKLFIILAALIQTLKVVGWAGISGNIEASNKSGLSIVNSEKLSVKLFRSIIAANTIAPRNVLPISPINTLEGDQL